MIPLSTCASLLRALDTYRSRARRFIRTNFVVPLKVLFFHFLYDVEVTVRLYSWRYWRQHPRVLAAMLFIVVSASLAGFQVWRVRSEKQRYLYYPEAWVFRPRSRESLRPFGTDNEHREAQSVGGGSLSVLPIDIKLYRVREGDTLSDIADRFGMDLDTIASLNREWGSGVHLIRIGEAIKIPNQDGIYIKIEEDLDVLCSQNGIPVEVVSAVNGVDPQQIKMGMELFFPGVQHTGIERSVITGSAFLKPVAGWLTSGFGYRRDPFTDQMHFHRGVDLAAPAGTAVRAALDGTVIAVGNDRVLGNYILVRHQINYSSLYGHLSQVWVSRGATVTRGQRIGAVGNTGMSTGPHLHFEIRRRGTPIDAWGLLSSRF